MKTLTCKVEALLTAFALVVGSSDPAHAQDCCACKTKHGTDTLSMAASRTVEPVGLTKDGRAPRARHFADPEEAPHSVLQILSGRTPVSMFAWSAPNVIEAGLNDDGTVDYDSAKSALISNIPTLFSFFLWYPGSDPGLGGMYGDGAGSGLGDGGSIMGGPPPSEPPTPPPGTPPGTPPPGTTPPGTPPPTPPPGTPPPIPPPTLPPPGTPPPGSPPSGTTPGTLSPSTPPPTGGSGGTGSPGGGGGGGGWPPIIIYPWGMSPPPPPGPGPCVGPTLTLTPKQSCSMPHVCNPPCKVITVTEQQIVFSVAGTPSGGGWPGGIVKAKYPLQIGDAGHAGPQYFVITCHSAPMPAGTVLITFVGTNFIKVCAFPIILNGIPCKCAPQGPPPPDPKKKEPPPGMMPNPNPKDEPKVGSMPIPFRPVDPGPYKPPPNPFGPGGGPGPMKNFSMPYDPCHRSGGGTFQNVLIRTNCNPMDPMVLLLQALQDNIAYVNPRAEEAQKASAAEAASPTSPAAGTKR